jgi:hypothetical protein
MRSHVTQEMAFGDRDDFSRSIDAQAQIIAGLEAQQARTQAKHVAFSQFVETYEPGVCADRDQAKSSRGDDADAIRKLAIEQDRGPRAPHAPLCKIA